MTYLTPTLTLALTLLGLFLSAPVQADYYVRSQAEVDAFAHSGELNLTLHIEPFWGEWRTDITDLSPLASLTGIKGSLIIEANPQLQSLKGLENLKFVEGMIYIKGNNSLQNLDGLSGLEAIGHTLYVDNNPQLRTMEGLANIQSAGPHELHIVSNTSLQHLNGLEWITCAKENLKIQLNDSLEHIRGLSGLQSVEKSLIIDRNPLLKNLDGLEALQVVGEDLTLNRLDALERIDGLENLRFIGWYFSIDYNPVLRNLDGLSNLTRTDGPIQIHKNLSLTNIDGLSNLEEMGYYLWVSFNPLLTNVDAFGSLRKKSVSVLGIIGNRRMTDISGLCHVVDPSFGSPYITIQDNSNLTVCTVISTWSHMSTNLEVKNNHPDCTDASVQQALAPCPEAPDPIVSNTDAPFFCDLHTGSPVFPDPNPQTEFLPLFPNPIEGQSCWLPFILAKGGIVSFRVIDRVGRERGHLAEAYFSKGQHRIEIDASALPEGSNYILMQTGEFLQARMYIKE